MDWSKVKQAIGTIAPWIAGTLGSPVAGVAVNALCGALGLSGQDANPTNVIAALAGASPEQLNSLRLADQRHMEVMQGLGYTHIETLEQYHVESINAARQREVDMAKAGKADNTPKWLAALAVALFLVLLAFVASGGTPDTSMRDGFWILATTVTLLCKDVYAYYFDSTPGSKAKDETIKQLSQGDQ